MRWTFTEIEQMAFHWTAERSLDGKTGGRRSTFARGERGRDPNMSVP